MKLRTCIAIVLAATALSAVASLATASPADAGARPCWKDLLDDWVDNVRIDGTYPASCYREAIKRLKGDLRDYSSAAEDIQRALSAAITANGGQDPSMVDPPDDQREPELLPPLGEPDDPTSDGGSGSAGGGDDGDGGLFEALLPRATGAASVPLPLLILAGLAMLLLGAAGVSYGARRMQARRAPVSGPPHP